HARTGHGGRRAALRRQRPGRHDRPGEDRARRARQEPGRHGRGGHGADDPRGGGRPPAAPPAPPPGPRGPPARPARPRPPRRPRPRSPPRPRRRPEPPAMAHQHSPAFLKLVEDAKSRVREFTLDEFLGRLQAGERYILLDVREDNEWAGGHIPGAHHMGRGVLERDIEKAIPEKEAPIVLYCGGGFRSALSADNLRKMGYTNVFSLGGGWRGWNERGLPTETGT